MVYDRLRQEQQEDETPVTAKATSTELVDESDALLEQLIALETRLEQDLARKSAHQKPLLQAQWREEIARINRLLM